MKPWRGTARSIPAPRSSRSRSRPKGWRARCATCWTRPSPTERVTRRQADLTLLVATAMWGTSFVAVKTGLAYATPLAFLTVRFGIAALLLAPGTRFTPLPRGRELWGGLLLGALVAVGFVSVTFGLLVTTPSRSAFIVAISSVLAPVIGFVVLGQRPGWLAAAALAVAGVGMYFLTAPDAGGLRRGARLDGCVREHPVLRAAGGGAASHVGGARGADLLLRAAVCGRGLVARRGRATFARPVGGRGADPGRYGARGAACPSTVVRRP